MSIKLNFIHKNVGVRDFTSWNNADKNMVAKVYGSHIATLPYVMQGGAIQNYVLAHGDGNFQGAAFYACAIKDASQTEKRNLLLFLQAVITDALSTSNYTYDDPRIERAMNMATLAGMRDALTHRIMTEIKNKKTIKAHGVNAYKNMIGLIKPYSSDGYALSKLSLATTAINGHCDDAAFLNNITINDIADTNFKKDLTKLKNAFSALIDAVNKGMDNGFNDKVYDANTSYSAGDNDTVTLPMTARCIDSLRDQVLIGLPNALKTDMGVLLVKYYKQLLKNGDKRAFVVNQMLKFATSLDDHDKGDIYNEENVLRGFYGDYNKSRHKHPMKPPTYSDKVANFPIEMRNAIKRELS